MVGCPEFSHIIRLDDIAAHKGQIVLNAKASERAALAHRFDLVSLDRLEAQLTLRPDNMGILLQGRMQAALAQNCIATQEPVPEAIDEPLHIRFCPTPEIGGEEVELNNEDCDVQFHDGKGIDVGEAVAQTLGLALNPYPRSTHADAVLRKAGVKSEDEARIDSSPFAALSAIKRK